MTTDISDNIIADIRETPDIETASEDYASRFRGGIGAYFLAVQSRMTVELLKNSSVRTVLDVGGGHGQLYTPLVAEGYAVTVTGSSLECFTRLAPTQRHDDRRFVSCNLLALPFEDHTFDAVIAFRLLPHLLQWRRLLSEMCRVAGKTVIFDYPDIRSFNIFYRLAFRLKRAVEKNTRTFRIFSRGAVVDALQGNGFGQISFHPQFFMPMVAYRATRSPFLARMIEGTARTAGLTRWLGSPIITQASPTRTRHS